MKNTKYFMMLTLLAVSSSQMNATDHNAAVAYEVETQSRHVDDTFKGQMHGIQNQLSDIRHEARDNSKDASNKRLNAIKAEIQALNKNKKFKNEDMHDTHIRTLERELRHAQNIVRNHGL